MEPATVDSIIAVSRASSELATYSRCNRDWNRVYLSALLTLEQQENRFSLAESLNIGQLCLIPAH